MMPRRHAAPDHFYPRPPRGGRLFPVAFVVAGFKFLSPPSARRATVTSVALLTSSKFLSTPSARRATDRGNAPGNRPADFYPRPPRGGRPRTLGGRTEDSTYFYPRPPRGGRPRRRKHSKRSARFLSTPSARRATSVSFCVISSGHISIHALREEGDSKNRDKSSIFKQIIQHSARI